MLGAEEWIGSLAFINSLDSFAGRHPRIFTAVPPPGVSPQGITGANNYLLAQPRVADHVRRAGPGAGVLFLMFDEQTEAAARGLGLNVAHPPAKLRQHLDSKITTTRLATRAGISSVPNVLARVDSYRTLREVAGELGPDVVVQLPLGDSGTTTFFISSEKDYRPHADEIAASPEVKVMKRIRCRQTTIEGCVTRRGTLAGPLMTELVGFPELTPFAGGWCGNEMFGADASALISPDVRRQAGRAVVSMGEQLRQEGYWGYFGLDFLLDQDSGELYLGEMNPRITGATPLTNLAAHDQNQPPLLLFHLLEWLGIDFSFDIEEFNQRWIEAAPAPAWSQLIIDNIRDEPETLFRVPPSGIWHMRPDGELRFARRAFNLQAVANESEAFFMRTIDAGDTTVEGWCVGRFVLRGRLIDDDYRLTARSAAWIRGFRQMFECGANRGLQPANSPAME
jgi:D-alanine-D-alanine ligase-like ATP-grasp enzyme